MISGKDSFLALPSHAESLICPQLLSCSGTGLASESSACPPPRQSSVEQGQQRQDCAACQPQFRC